MASEGESVAFRQNEFHLIAALLVVIAGVLLEVVSVTDSTIVRVIGISCAVLAGVCLFYDWILRR